jgi:hypothetical protein
MTSETFVFGGPVPEKVAIGARVREYAATLGAGHVEAAVENRGGRIRVVDARAYPLRAIDRSIRQELEEHLGTSGSARPRVKP